MRRKEVRFPHCKVTAKSLAGIALFVTLSSTSASAQLPLPLMPFTPAPAPKVVPTPTPPTKFPTAPVPTPTPPTTFPTAPAPTAAPTPCQPPKDLLACKKNYDMALGKCDQDRFTNIAKAADKRAQCAEMDKQLKILFDQAYDKEKDAWGQPIPASAREYKCTGKVKAYRNFNDKTSYDLLQAACVAQETCWNVARALEAEILPAYEKCKIDALTSFKDQCNAVACQIP